MIAPSAGFSRDPEVPLELPSIEEVDVLRMAVEVLET